MTGAGGCRTLEQMKDFTVAAVQMAAGLDAEANWERAEPAVLEAAQGGADLVVLPEMFIVWGRVEQLAAAAQPLDGEWITMLAELACRAGVHLLAGSIPVRGESKAYNTALLFDPDGCLLAEYRKMHLFDLELPGRISFQESRYFAPGEAIVVAELPFGKVGLSICYDLRFPELYRLMVDLGVEILAVPSAFSHPTGEVHWRPVCQTRALENQSYLVACNQCGKSPSGFVSYGHTMVVDPWGVILAEAGEEPQIITARLSAARLEEVRRQLPLLEHRRLGRRPPGG